MLRIATTVKGFYAGTLMDELRGRLQKTTAGLYALAGMHVHTHSHSHTQAHGHTSTDTVNDFHMVADLGWGSPGASCCSYSRTRGEIGSPFSTGVCLCLFVWACVCVLCLCVLCLFKTYCICSTVPALAGGSAIIK